MGLLLILGSPKVAIAVPRHVVQMGDPDDTNDKPSSGPGIRDNTTAYAQALPTKMSTAPMSGTVARGLTTSELVLLYLRLLGFGGVR